MTVLISSDESKRLVAAGENDQPTLGIGLSLKVAIFVDLVDARRKLYDSKMVSID